MNCHPAGDRALLEEQPPLNDGKKRASKDYKANAPSSLCSALGELVPFHFGRRRRRNKPRRKFVGMRGEIKYGTESSTPSVVAKTHTSLCHENAEKGCGKKQARQRAFLFYIHEFSCPPLYFIALPLRPAASSSRAAPHGRTQDSRIA